MRLAKLAVGLLLVAGCAKGKPQKGVDYVRVDSTSHQIVPPSSEAHAFTSLNDSQKIKMLREEVHKRGLEFRIFCVWWQDDDTFNASAWHSGQRDDDEHDRWIVEAPTQADAAYALYNAIQGSPTHPAKPIENPDESREARLAKKRLMCPPELRGN